MQINKQFWILWLFGHVIFTSSFRYNSRFSNQNGHSRTNQNSRFPCNRNTVINELNCKPADIPAEFCPDLRVKTSENDLSITKARAILLTVSALYGTNFGCVKILGDAMDPSLAAFLRFSLAALVFAPNMIQFIKKNPALVAGGLEVGAYSAIGYWGQSQALLTSSASTTAFICSLAVIVVPILDMFFGNRKLKNRAWYEELLPALVAVVGVGCLELGGTTLPGIGDVWAFIQPLFFGLGFWRIEQHMLKTTGEKGEAQAFTGAMMMVVSVFAMIWAAGDLSHHGHGNFMETVSMIKQQLLALNDWHVFAAIAWTGIVTTAITSYGENVAMKRLSAAESTVIYSTEPIWGTAFAAVTLHESIGWHTIVGASLVILACLWSCLGSTLQIAGLFSTSKELESGTEEIFDNMAANWIELMNRISSATGPACDH